MIGILRIVQFEEFRDDHRDKLNDKQSDLCAQNLLYTVQVSSPFS